MVFLRQNNWKTSQRLQNQQQKQKVGSRRTFQSFRYLRLQVDRELLLRHREDVRLSLSRNHHRAVQHNVRCEDHKEHYQRHQRHHCN